MVRQKSQTAAEIDARVAEAVLGVQSGLYKSSYKAAKLLGKNHHVIVTPLGICHSGGIESSGRILGDSTGFLFFTNCNFPLS
jgi:hypothetical protein